MNLKLLVIFITATLFLGCSTILNEDEQSVNITTSNGKSIEGTIDGKPFTAPGIAKMKRTKASKIIEVSTPGCNPKTNVNSQVDPKFFINILSGGALGSTTDYVSEKMWRYDENISITCKN